MVTQTAKRITAEMQRREICRRREVRMYFSVTRPLRRAPWCGPDDVIYLSHLPHIQVIAFLQDRP